MLNDSTQIVGRLGGDPVVRVSPTDGSEFVTFNLAVTKKRKDQPEHTKWVSCSVSGQSGEVAKQYLKKGDIVALEGTQSAGVYKNNHTNSIEPILRMRVNELYLLPNDREPKQPIPAQPDPSIPDAADFNPDDLPT